MIDTDFFNHARDHGIRSRLRILFLYKIMLFYYNKGVGCVQSHKVVLKEGK
jgi:hypothetical protein